jgi:L-alanine-DL-glutamate epimerase-like enolase superfamily enzyme
MKIASIDIIALRVPLKKPYKLSKVYGTLTHTEPVVVKLTTDTGLVGYGECDPMIPFTEETPSTVVEILKSYIGPAVIGTPPDNIAALHERMESAVKGNYLAKAAVDLGCYDIFGKSLKVPVHQLLGGKLRESIPLMGSLGSDTPESNARETEALIAAGYASTMIKVGGDPSIDVRRVHAVREAAGPAFPLIVDANQGWDARTAVAFARAIEADDIALFEQPIAHWDIEGLADIRKAVSIPLCADESLFTLQDAKRLIRQKAVDAFSIKVVKHGGIHKAREIMTLAEIYGVPCLMNSMIEEGISQAGSLQLGASSKGLLASGHAYFSPTRLEKDISNYSSLLDRGTVAVTDAPGLGIEVFEEVVQEYAVGAFHI